MWPFASGFFHLLCFQENIDILNQQVFYCFVFLFFAFELQKVPDIFSLFKCLL